MCVIRISVYVLIVSIESSASQHISIMIWLPEGPEFYINTPWVLCASLSPEHSHGVTNVNH